MDALATSVQDMLINMREGFENSLLESVMRLEEQATAGREQDQIALVTTKNNLWKELSWIVRDSLQSGRRSGYSSGPFIGLLNLAQREDPHFISHGFEDGYNPYGFGDFGFGYGSA